MLSAEHNDILTRSGPGTPGGKLMRCYWQPAALVDELAGNRPVRPVRLLGENLVLFRDEQGHHGLIDCNWLQSLEVGIDPVHTSFLHRFFHDEDPKLGYGKLFRDTSIGSEIPMTQLMREHPRPQIEIEPTDFGMRIVTLRKLGDADMHVRVTNLVFPHGFVIPMSSEMTITQWHVPIDDTRHYWYAIFTSFGAPVDKAEMRRQRLQLYELPDYVPRKNKSNDYGFDPHEQAHATFTGMGVDINVHDQWACESMGPIADRTREHLGQSDKAITSYRRLLRGAIEQVGNGGTPPMVLDPGGAARVTGPAAIDGIGPTRGWESFWMEVDVKRRRGAPWAAPIPAEIADKVRHLSAAE